MIIKWGWTDRSWIHILWWGMCYDFFFKLWPKIELQSWITSTQLRDCGQAKISTKWIYTNKGSNGKQWYKCWFNIKDEWPVKIIICELTLLMVEISWQQLKIKK